jgi:hypothetical protein
MALFFSRDFGDNPVIIMRNGGPNEAAAREVFRCRGTG